MTLHRSQLVVLAIAALALLLASFAWWHHYRSGRRALETWTSSYAVLIRHAPQVELLVLEPEPESESESESERTAPHGSSPPPDGEQLEIAGQLYQVRQRQDISRVAGLVHARHALIQDLSYEWLPQPARQEAQWDMALQFRDGQRQATLALSFDMRTAHLLETGRQATLTPRINQSLRDYLEAQQPRDRRLPRRG